MNERQLSIIKQLSDLDEKITLKDLAQTHGVSVRTIRNDLKQVDDLLSAEGLSLLQFKRGGEISRASDFQEVGKVIEADELQDYRLSVSERQKIAVSIIAVSSGFITLGQIADQLLVSRATIIKDLDAIKKMIAQAGLEVTSHPNKGLLINGKESSKRMFLMKILTEEKHEVISRWLNILTDDADTLKKLLSEQERIQDCYFHDADFKWLLLYLRLMVARNRDGFFVEKQAGGTNTQHYRFAQELLKNVTQYLKIETTSDEVAFLSALAGRMRTTRMTALEKETIKFQLITRQFIAALSEELGVNLNDDYEFFENLASHLESILALDEVVYPDPAEMREMIENSKEEMNAVIQCLPIIEAHAARKITENDINYIVIHVMAALERKRNKNRSFSVIVVCHVGVGTSKLLLERLKKNFNFNVKNILTSHEAEQIEEGACDLVISTVPLKNMRVPHLVVSPLLGDEDYVRVGNKVRTLLEQSGRKGESELQGDKVVAMMNEIGALLDEQVPEVSTELMKKIRKIVKNHFKEQGQAKNEIFSPYLHHLLTPEFITLDVEAEDWRDAVRKSGEKLVERGFVESRYIDAMIGNIEENGPYVVLSRGFAVPHEGVDSGSLRVGMNLIRLKTPVPFGDEENDPVEFVCALSAVDHETHLKAFFNLVNPLLNEDFKERLREARESREVHQIIKKFEYELS